MITEVQLKKLKRTVAVAYEDELIGSGCDAAPEIELIDELIAALEQAWAERDVLEHERQCTEHLMTSPNDRWGELEEWLDKAGYINQSFLLRCDEERVTLRKQLAEVETDNLQALELIVKGQASEIELISQLTEAQAELAKTRTYKKELLELWESESEANRNYREQLAEANK